MPYYKEREGKKAHVVAVLLDVDIDDSDMGGGGGGGGGRAGRSRGKKSLCFSPISSARALFPHPRGFFFPHFFLRLVRKICEIIFFCRF